jgi:DNA polymerase-1
MSFIKSYLDKADANDVLHPQINTCKAITARESCENPNLQNVEKDRAVKNPFPVPMRLCFRPRPGYVNFHVDYSGIEMRLIVHYCGEEILTKILNEGGDVHDPATNIFWGDLYRDGDKATRKALRDCAKNGSFCIAYGGAIPKLAATINLTVAETAPKYRLFKMMLPRVANLMPETIREVKSTGKIITAFGRHIHIPRDQAYMGTNYKMQATAAEILKRAQTRVHNYLEKATGGEMKILLPIHDELIIECPRKYLKDAKPVLRHCSKLMTDFPGRFRVPLAVEFKVATTDWAHKQDFSLVD